MLCFLGCVFVCVLVPFVVKMKLRQFSMSSLTVKKYLEYKCKENKINEDLLKERYWSYSLQQQNRRGQWFNDFVYLATRSLQWRLYHRRSMQDNKSKPKEHLEVIQHQDPNQNQYIQNTHNVHIQNNEYKVCYVRS